MESHNQLHMFRVRAAMAIDFVYQAALVFRWPCLMIFLCHFLAGCNEHLSRPSQRPTAHLTFDDTIQELHSIRKTGGMTSRRRNDEVVKKPELFVPPGAYTLGFQCYVQKIDGRLYMPPVMDCEDGFLYADIVIEQTQPYVVGCTYTQSGDVLLTLTPAGGTAIRVSSSLGYDMRCMGR